MSWFLATIYDRFMRKAEEAGLGAWRGELLAPVGGDVLEIGAGTGANLACYGPDVRRLVLAEPEPRMRARLEARLAAAGRNGHAEVADAAAEKLPFADGTFDVVVATLVLCSVADPRAALAEIHRVLRPGGCFVFLEHVAAGDAARLRWQHRVEPVWKRLADNCHLTRQTEQLIVQAGFGIEDITRESMRKAMPVARPTVRGVARRPG